MDEKNCCKFNDECIEVELADVVTFQQSDYNKLNNKPEINGVVLEGNKSAEELGLIAVETDPTVPEWAKAETKPTYTKDEVGLGEVDNTSDMDKPISTAVKSALEGKANSADLATVATSGSYTDLTNKPTIPTTTSELTNNSGFITKAVDDLVNYYTKTQVDGEISDLESKISAIPKFAISVVDSLPTSNISGTTIYLLKTSQTETNNLYTEFIYVNNTWESLGTQTLDLTGYATEEWVSTQISVFLTETQVNALIAKALENTVARANVANKVANALTVSGQNDSGTEQVQSYDGSNVAEVAFNEDDFTVTKTDNVVEVALREGVIPDTSSFVTKSQDETISGVKTFTSAPKMDTLENSRGNAMYHFNGDTAHFGQVTFPTVIRGSEERPKYQTETTVEEIALKKDIPESGGGETNLYLVSTEAEMNALLTEDNVGKYIKFVGKTGSGEPIAVGDVISKLYFDTSVIPNPEQLTDWEVFQESSSYKIEKKVLFETSNSEVVIAFYKQSVPPTDSTEIQYMLGCGASLGLENLVWAYSATNKPSDLGLDSWGWQTDTHTFSESGTVTSVNEQQDIWGAYITKEKSVAINQLYEIVIGHEPIAIGDTLTDLYFNTDKSIEEVDAIFDQLDWDNPDIDDSADLDDVGEYKFIYLLNKAIFVLKMNATIEGTFYKGYALGDSGQPIYASTDAIASAFGKETAGWDETVEADWEASRLPMTVETVGLQQDIWGQLVAKSENFAGSISTIPVITLPVPDETADIGKVVSVGESGEYELQTPDTGLKLNKFTYQTTGVPNHSVLRNILTTAKGNIAIRLNYWAMCNATCTTQTFSDGTVFINVQYQGRSSTESTYDTAVVGCALYVAQNNMQYAEYTKIAPDGTITTGTKNPFTAGVEVTYWNDTEIT